jgi:hypothetical protein
VFAHRLSARRAAEQLARILGLDLSVVDTGDLVEPTFELSLR